LLSNADFRDSKKCLEVEVPLKGWFIIQKKDEDLPQEISVLQKRHIDSFMDIVEKSKP
jgi:predicted nucleic acid-binding protein